MADKRFPLGQAPNEQRQQLQFSPSPALAKVDTAAEHQEKEREVEGERKNKEEQEGKKDSNSQIQSPEEWRRNEQVDQHVSSSPNNATVTNKTEAEQATFQDDVTVCSSILAPDSLTASAAKNRGLQQRKRSCDSASSGAYMVNMNAKKSKLSCPICYEEINMPHTLHSCGHTACKGCLSQWFETSEKTGTLLPSCPICRTDVDQEDAACVMGRPFQPVGSSSSSSSTSDSGLDELTEHWLAESSAKRCRNCQSWIIKEDGCNLMECLCGYRFCWECGIPGGRACGCSPSNHYYWDNINGENANETSSVATSHQLSNFRAFLLHRRCNNLATQCVNALCELLECHKLKTTCKDILQSLLSHEYGWLFSEPVDPVALQIPDYYHYITRPMDLGFIRFYIDNGYYSSLSVFRRHVHLTFDNAMLYNGQGSKIHAIAEEMKAKFDDDFQNYVQQDLLDVASYGSSLNRCFADDERKYVKFLKILGKHERGVIKIENIEEEVTQLLQAEPEVQKNIMAILWQCTKR